jgi:ABC-type multidrug transport system fused ATPase/permease subunit
VITNLRQRFSNKTFLFVTHRLGNLRKADRILVMDRGQLVEDGSWQELIRARGIFSTLALQQHENTNSEPAMAEK